MTDLGTRFGAGWARAFGIVAALAPIGMVVQFHRTSIATVAPEIRADLALSPEIMGAVGGTLFLSFALCQMPVGILLDRFGPRRVATFGLLLMAVGAVYFAAAETASALIAARVVVGVGTSGLYLSGMMVCSRWFGASRFAFFTGILFALGNVGSLIATLPLAAAADLWGWRPPYLAVALATAAVAALVWFAVEDWPPDAAPAATRPETLAESLRGLRAVFLTPNLPFVLAIGFVGYAGSTTISSLWGGPYLRDVHGVDAVGRGWILCGLVLAATCGSLIYGPLDRRLDTRRNVVLAGVLMLAAALASFALWPAPSLAVAIVHLYAIGVTGAFGIIALAHGRSLFPERLVGRGMTTVNMCFSFGVAFFQGLTGLVIGAFEPVGGVPPPEAYRAAFAVVAVGALISAAIYARAPDAPPSRDGERKASG